MTTWWRTLARRAVPRGVRNWLRSPAGTLRWLRDGGLDAARGPVTVEVRPGWRLVCPRAAWRLAYGAHVGDPEQTAELDAFVATCRGPVLLFDVGAHFGLFSFAALHYGGPGSRAVAVEPSPLAVRMARRVARRNALADRLDIVVAAAGACEGGLMLVDAGVQAAGYYVPADRGHPAGERSPVRAVTVDALARRFGVPTHLKIDVEGMEEDVLRGARGVLAGPAAPILLLELHHGLVRGRGGDPAGVLDLLAGLGFVVSDPAGRVIGCEALLGRDLARVVARRKAG
jgi:FkbM family methyltransferase